MVKRWLWAYSYLGTAHRARSIIALADRAAYEHGPGRKCNGEGNGNRFSHGSRFPGRRKSYRNEQTRPAQQWHSFHQSGHQA